MQDIAEGRIRLIGDPVTRYREDPVRMIRAVRLAAKLNLEIHPDTAAPIAQLAPLLDNMPSARLFDEFLKVFATGHALESYRRLCTHGLFAHLFPATARWLASDAEGKRQRFIEQALMNTDRRIVEGLPVTPMFLFGVFLWGPVQERAAALRKSGDMSENQALIDAGMQVTDEQILRVSLPRRFSVPMREMLQLQPRFMRQQGRRTGVLLQHRRFRAAYDLLVLRLELVEVTAELVDWWTKIQTLSPEEQQKEFGGQQQQPQRQGSRRRRRRPAASAS